MKVLAVFLAVLAVAAGYEFKEVVAAQDRSISSTIVDFIESLKIQMPCGFPRLGIPPLAPLVAEHRELHLKGENFEMDGIVDGFRVDGMDNFDILELKVNSITSKVTFAFNWNDVFCTTLYDMDYSTETQGLNVKLHRKDKAKLSLKDLKVWGTARYSLGVIGGGNLRLKEFKMFVSLGKVKSEIGGLFDNKIMNRLANEVIEEFIMLSINDNTENFAEISNQIVVPLVNSLIGDMSVGDLIGKIVGGGGGSGGEGGEKEECIVEPIKRDANGVWSYSFV